MEDLRSRHGQLLNIIFLILLIPGKLFRAIRALFAKGKKNAFKQGRLFRMSKTPNELLEADLVDDGDGATFLHIPNNCPIYPSITFMGR